MTKKFVIILTTCASSKEASKILDMLLKKRLIACGNIIRGVESRFWWNGKIDKVNEALIILKTSADNFKKVELEIKKTHSYEIPEIVALPIIKGSEDYLRWITASVKT